MRAERRVIDTGRGIRAKRRSPLSTNQPLKSGLAAKRPLILISVLLICAAVLMFQKAEKISATINRPVVKVRIENQWQQLREEEVKSILAPFIGTGFFNFDVGGAQQQLLNHPWIAEVSVQRLWPDSVSLDITEEVAIARWGELEFLNQYGEIFSPLGSKNLTNLPIITGPDDSQFAVMEAYQEMNQILFPSGLRLNGLTLSPRGSWNLQLNEHMHVAVGRGEVSEKLIRFAKFFENQPVQQSDQFRYIDLRYGNGIAIRNIEQELTGVAIR